ncbi:HNH endonuclease, partial [Amycolatopsis roodepoortensis]
MSETFLPELPQELWRAGKLELAHGVLQSLRVIRVATAGLGRFLAEVESRGAKDLFGHGSTASWLAEMAGLSRGEAGAVVKRAIALNPTRNLDGTEAPAVAPETA